MMRRAVLLITDKDAQLFRGPDAIVRIETFDPLAVQILSDSITPNTTLSVIYDQIAIEIKQDTLPPVGRLDRKKLSERRLAAAFSSTLLNGIVATIGQQLVMAGVHDNPSARFWQQVLDETNCALDAETLLPIEAAFWSSRLLPEARQGWCLLTLSLAQGSYRQIVTHRTVPVMTRLIEPSALDADQIAEFLLRECGATLDFLPRLGLDEEEQVSCLFLSENEILDALKAHNENLFLTLFTPQNAAYRLGFACETVEQLAAASVRRKKRHAFWRPSVRTLHNRRMVRLGLCAASVLFLGMAFLLDLARYPFYAALMTERTRLIATIAAQEKSNLAYAAALHLSPAEVELNRKASELKQYYATPALTPWPVFRIMTAALATRPISVLWTALGGQAETVVVTFAPGTNGGPDPRPILAAAVTPGFRVRDTKTGPRQSLTGRMDEGSAPLVLTLTREAP